MLKRRSGDNGDRKSSKVVESPPSPSMTVPKANPSSVPKANLTPVPKAKPTPVPKANLTPVPKASPTPVPKAKPTPVIKDKGRTTRNTQVMKVKVDCPIHCVFATVHRLNFLKMEKR